MDYSFSVKDSIGTYHLKGNLIGETDGIALVESFTDQLDKNVRKFIIDLEDLQHINSSGLGVLITLLTKARKQGGELVLVHPSEHIKNLLLITKLNTIFSVFSSYEPAKSALDS